MYVDSIRKGRRVGDIYEVYVASVEGVAMLARLRGAVLSARQSDVDRRSASLPWQSLGARAPLSGSSTYPNDITAAEKTEPKAAPVAPGGVFGGGSRIRTTWQGICAFHRSVPVSGAVAGGAFCCLGLRFVAFSKQALRKLRKESRPRAASFTCGASHHNNKAPGRRRTQHCHASLTHRTRPFPVGGKSQQQAARRSRRHE